MPKQKRVSVSKRLDSIDKKMKRIEKEEEKIEKNEEIIEKKEEKVDKKINLLLKEEENLEKVVLRIGRLNFKRGHLLELIRASAGAFLGVGIGRGLLGLDNIAKGLPWVNVISILIFILVISSLLIYKDQKDNIKTKGKIIIFQRLFFIYFVSLLIEFISLLLFNVQYDSLETLMKIMIVGSYTAMASAITFSLSK